MAGNNIKINLLFQADTTAAVANMQQLGKALNDISRNTTVGINNGSLQKAVQSAQQLQVHLQNAVNIDTGKLDLNKLNASLKSSGQNLQTLTTNLQAAGPTGQQAFIKVATAIASAEAPMVQINKRLKDFGITLANTVKWQIASTAVHSLQGMLSAAVTHAEDLNRALNDIRIVTGYSTTTMAQFADRASSAAKELSTTTTEYAKAALIFYQQGKTGNEVEERANTVIKLAQVTGQSAQVVSDQMTAIWNNFDDGAHSLEYYADALTKLGAATAASTDEISDGLEKFASIARTVGLSYDTAAAAVATVVDKTRESADVVGTAFKTIFGRMQGLQLGETLEDGVDLNKYSKALEAVGVEVLNAEGEVRKMDDILSDLGDKWQGFGESTKIAIAQTVGGMRQYNQMMSLMENWDAVEENIELAKNATGELTQQQNIWAESYEAAAQRIKQAQNELYESFIDDESIVTINNLIADLISSVGNLIDAFGGVGPVLLTIGMLFSKTIIPLIGNGIKSIGNAISVWSGKAAKEVIGMQNDMQAQISATMTKAGFSEGVRQQLELSKQLIGVKQQLTLSSKSMTVAEQEEAAARIAMYEAMVAETQQILAKKAAMEEELRVLKLKVSTETPRSQKRKVATKTTTENFKAENAHRDSDEVDDIVEEASTRSLGETRGELQQLEQQIATKDSRLADKKSELARVRQQIASHEKELEQKLEQNTSSGWDTKDGQHHLQALEEAQKREKELTAEIAEIADEDYSGRIERLHEVIDLQEQIQSNTEQETETMSHGKVNSEIFANTLNESGSDIGGYTSSMANKAISQISGEMADGGGVSVDASIANIEKLFGIIGQYKTQLAEITAVQQDFESAEKELAAAFQESGDEIAAAQQEVAEADAEVQTKTEALTVAENKLAQERAKGPKNAKNIASAEKEVANAAKEVQKAQNQLTETFNKQPAAFKKVAKAQQTILNSEDKYIALAKAAGASESEITELSNAFAKFKNTGNPADLNPLTSTLKNLKIASMDTISGLDGLAIEMRDMMVAAGMSPDKIDPIINKLRELSNQAPQVQAGLNGVGAEGQALGAKFSVSAASISTALTSIATAAGQLSMGISGINALVNAFDEGNTPMETFMGILTGITMIAPVVSGLFKKIADAKKKDTVETTANTVAIIANTAAESSSIIAKGAKTVATWLLNAALAVQRILENPVTGAIIVGAALAAAAAITIKTKAVEKQNEELRKNNEENMKNAESTNNLSTAWADQMSTMDNLISKYRKLDQASEDYQQTVEDIIDAVPDLIDAYSQLAEGLDLTAAEQEEFNQYVREMKEAASVGDVEAIAETQTKMDNLLSPKAVEEAKNGANAAMNLTAQAMAEEGGAKFKDNKVTRHVGGVSTKTIYDENGNILGGEEQASVDILNKYGVGTKTGAEGFNVELDASDSGKFLEDYEALMAAAKEMENTLGEHLDNSDTYREIKEMLDASKEQYEQFTEMQAEAEKYGVINAKTNIEKSKEEGGLGYGIEDIDSLKEYNEYRQAMIDDIAGEDATAEEIAQAEAAVDAWLEAQGAVQGYTDAKHKLGYISTQVGKAAEEAAKAAGKSDEEAAVAAEEARAARQAELETFFDTLDADQQKFLLEVDFSKYQNEEAITTEIARLQNIADQDTIKVKIEAVNTAQSSLKESGMTEEDWIGIRDSGIEWGKDGVMKFTEFLALSYEEQSQYLERIKGAQEGLLETTIENSIADLQAGLAALDAARNNGEYSVNIEQYEVERQAILDNIEALEGEIAIRQKLAESKEIEEYELDPSLIEDLKEVFNEDNSQLKLEVKDDHGGKYFKDAALSAEELNEANKDAAIGYARLNRAIKDISDNYEDYEKVLKDVQKTSVKEEKAFIANSENGKKLQATLADLLNTSEDLIDADLLSAIDPKDFKKAAEGDTEAIERIQDAFIKLQAEANNIDFEGLKSELDQLEEGVIVDIEADTMPFLWALIEAKVAAGADAAEIQSLLSGFNIQAEVTDFLGTLEQAKAAASDAATSIVEDTSYTQTVDTVTGGAINQNDEVAYDTTITYTRAPTPAPSRILKGAGDELTELQEVRYEAHKTVDPKPIPNDTTTEVTGASVNTKTGSGKSGNVKGVQIKNAHKAPTSSRTPTTTNNNNTSGGGGGGSKPAEKKKNSDVVDRYKEVTDKINLNTQAMNKASKAADNLYGKARINNMKTINELLAKELELLVQKRQEAEDYLGEDKSEIDRLGSEVNTLLTKAIAAAGITPESMDLKIDFDPNTKLMTDSTTVLSNMVTLYNQLVDAWTQEDGTILEAQQEQLDKLWESIEEYKSATEQYDETLGVIVEIDERSIDITNEQLENNFNAWKESLEFDLSLNESDLEYIEYQLGKVENSVYGISEAIGLLSDKGKEYEDNLIILGNAYKELNTQFGNGQISSARYHEELSELRSQIIENLEAIRELDEAVEDYYSDTLSMAQEEISKVIDLMDNATNVLDHYYSLMDLFGKQKDFDKIGKILNAQATVSENAYKASSEAYKMFRAEADARKTDYYNAITEGASQEEIDRLKNRWIEAENAAAETQDRMLSDAEAWAEDLNSILENDLAKAADTLENALTGTFGSFDELISQLDRANSLQEEFLTTTNKIYETNKLIRNAQKEIDKTTNSAAKRELKNFINKTNELQQQGKLSQYELEIQQAKYDLLLAEIALKEAQNAKSTVRLQRDSEGNFGYVYTADQNAITDAQQKYEDAQNALYNKGLEGANNYTQKYIETMSEMYDELTEIQQRDDLTEEERKQARLEATNYYYQKLKDYSYLHQVALTTDSRVAADAWSKDFAWMTESTETWMTNVNTYTTEVDKAITSYLGKINAENGVAKSLESLAENTDTITKKSKELKDMIGDDTKGLIYALEKEFDAVHKNVLEYEALRKEMQKTIDAKESFANSLLKEQKVAELIGSTVYYALNGQTLRFDDYNAETGEVLVSDPETGNNMWVDERLIASSNSTTKKEVGSRGDNSYNFSYTDIFGKNQNFDAKRYEVNWDINSLFKLLPHFGFDNIDFSKIYKSPNKNNGYVVYEYDPKTNSYEVHSPYEDIVGPRSYWGATFDTGGYTGEWGPYGKMAMLHEKELILNQHDTENLLASMEFLTRVLEIIDLQSLNNQLGGSLLLPSTLNTESNTLEQNVHIEASFPNVVDHSEIELAFNDLINISSQYANRK